MLLKNTVTFDKSATDDILSILGKSVDEEGYLVLKSKPTQRVLTVDGEEIRHSDFAGVKKGSEIYIKSDLNSLIDLADIL